MNFYNFLKGRYGIDDLTKFLGKIFLILLIINLFLKNLYIDLVKIILVIIIIWRTLSKKIYRRSNANVKFLNIKKSLFAPFKKIKDSLNDNDYVYKKCHHCHKKLKLPVPSKRGIKHVVCPKCHKKNTFIVLKQIKIEIIKGK